MAISSVVAPTVSYNTLKTGSMSVKGQQSTTATSQTKSANSASTTAKADTASLSSSASSQNKTYTIGGDTVSKAVFDQYDSNSDGQISADELKAYEASKSSSSSDTTAAKDSDGDNDGSAPTQKAAQTAATTQSALLGGIGTKVNTYA